MQLLTAEISNFYIFLYNVCRGRGRNRRPYIKSWQNLQKSYTSVRLIKFVCCWCAWRHQFHYLDFLIKVKMLGELGRWEGVSLLCRVSQGCEENQACSQQAYSLFMHSQWKLRELRTRNSCAEIPCGRAHRMGTLPLISAAILPFSSSRGCWPASISRGQGSQAVDSVSVPHAKGSRAVAFLCFAVP